MKLYYFPGACSLADHIVLEWIGIAYQTVKLDHAGTKSPAYLALNPNGTVPLPVDGDFVLSQNAAILFYLAEINPDARLLGDGTPQGRADMFRGLMYGQKYRRESRNPLSPAKRSQFVASGRVPSQALPLICAKRPPHTQRIRHVTVWITAGLDDRIDYMMVLVSSSRRWHAPSALPCSRVPPATSPPSFASPVPCVP